MAILDWFKKKPKTPYQELGEEAGIAALVDRFYEIMDTDKKAKTIRDLHPKDLTTARLKLKEFLMGWMGGPQVYTEKYGHPRMRMRHLPFPIGTDEREQWLYCMFRAMEELKVSELLREQMRVGFTGLAEKIQNKD